ncbi:hypothetical protein [Microvirga sp. TS319]
MGEALSPLTPAGSLPPHVSRRLASVNLRMALCVVRFMTNGAFWR